MNKLKSILSAAAVSLVLSGGWQVFRMLLAAGPNPQNMNGRSTACSAPLIVLRCSVVTVSTKMFVPPVTG